jgi:RNA polymerase sigma-70 factor (ECF subfamily)
VTNSSQAVAQPGVPERELYGQSGAARYGFSEADFAGLLAEVTAKYLPPETPASAVDQFCRSLHLEELVLARACAAGSETGWEVFLTRYRARLYEMAACIAHDEVLARELADSVYADLYGVHTRAGRRISKLSYYMGRGSLEGWLRTVLAQDFVNGCRSRKRTVSLEEQEEAGEQFTSPPLAPAAAADPRLEEATDETLAALGAEDRLVLSAYFLENRRLAEIAQILKVHESTVSRRMVRLTKQLRKTVVRKLMTRGFDRRTAEEALDATDVRDLSVDVRGRLHPGDKRAGVDSLQAGAEPAFYKED